MKNVMSDRKSLFEGLDRKLDRAEQRKQNKTKLVKGKRVWGKSEGKQVPTSKSPLLVESHREQLSQQPIVIQCEQA